MLAYNYRLASSHLQVRRRGKICRNKFRGEREGTENCFPNTLKRELVGQTLSLDEFKKRGRCYRTLIKDDD
jgi:hypothetical protein